MYSRALSSVETLVERSIKIKSNENNLVSDSATILSIYIKINVKKYDIATNALQLNIP